MTNYQGWTDETDISNSTELSSMIFHYEREIGLYGINYITKRQLIVIMGNWIKWQINDTQPLIITMNDL